MRFRVDLNDLCVAEQMEAAWEKVLFVGVAPGCVREL